MQIEVGFDSEFFVFVPCFIDAELQCLSISGDSSNYLWRGSDFDFSSCRASHGITKEQVIYKPDARMSCGSGLSSIPLDKYTTRRNARNPRYGLTKLLLFNEHKRLNSC